MTYTWTDNATEVGVANCDPDILNANLMHLKYENTPNLSTPFALNSGNVTAGEADVLAYSGTTLSFKVGGAYANLLMTSANKTQKTVTSIVSLTGLSTNGIYTVLYDFATETAISVLSSKVTTGKVAPVSPQDGDFWFDTSTIGVSYKYSGTTKVETQYVPIGGCVVSGGVITSVTTNQYNQNGYDVQGSNVRYIVDTYVNGTSWYRVWSDGWIEQGGRYTGTPMPSQINLLKKYKDTNYNVQAFGKGSNLTVMEYSDRTTSYFTLVAYTPAGTWIYFEWRVCGY